jgi:putative membrane protein
LFLSGKHSFLCGNYLFFNKYCHKRNIRIVVLYLLNKQIHMKKINLLPLPVIAVALLQACSGTRNTTGSDSTGTQTDSQSTSTQTASSVGADSAFANKAAISGMAEVALGKMAAAKGASSPVKEFGNMMVTDHGKANAELMGIAQKKGLTLPTGLDAEHQAKSDSLSRLSGAEFDRAYIKVMIEGHNKTLALINAEATGGQDMDLRSFAAKTSPVVQHHLDEITKIQTTLK